MKTIQTVKEILRRRKDELKAEYGIGEIGIFGSFVRGEQSTDSDLDILVSFDSSMGLLKFIRLEHHLSDILGMKVDLVMKDALKPKIGEHILQELVQV